MIRSLLTERNDNNILCLTELSAVNATVSIKKLPIKLNTWIIAVDGNTFVLSGETEKCRLEVVSRSHDFPPAETQITAKPIPVNTEHHVLQIIAVLFVMVCFGIIWVNGAGNTKIFGIGEIILVVTLIIIIVRFIRAKVT